MGSAWETIAYGPSETYRKAIESAFHEIERIESLLSRFRPDSEIFRINRLAGQGWIPVHPEVCRVVAQALRYAALTGGAFDPTTGTLSHLWGFGSDGPRSVPPDAETIQETLERVAYRHVLADEAHSVLMILQPGIELDLGGMGKGYAIDRVVAILRAYGIEQGWVSCGSTSFALGSPPKQVSWRVGIRDPKRPDRVIQTVQIRDRAISTSAAYEQFFTYEGKRYGHILDPRTGYPAEGPAGVTVIAPTATEADILSTAAFVLGVEAGKALLMSQEEVEACFLEERKGDVSILSTHGWDRMIQGGLNRRRFLTSLLAVLGLLVLRPPVTIGAVYMTDKEALHQILPEALEFVKETITLTAEQKEEVGEFLGKQAKEETYTFYRAIGPDPTVTIGYAVVLDVVGRERPITFLIGVNPQVRIIGLEVLIYRESQGSEIRSKRFMRQFIGKTVQAPLKLGRDIDGISGATLSCRSTAYAVKKALTLTQVIYGLRAEGGS